MKKQIKIVIRKEDIKQNWTEYKKYLKKIGVKDKYIRTPKKMKLEEKIKLARFYF